MGNKKINLIWYLILIITLGAFISFIFIEKNHQKSLLKKGNVTIGMCVYKDKSPLDYKQRQNVTWIYKIDGAFFKKNTNASGDIQNGEFFNIYYNPSKKSETIIAYTEFILKGTYENTVSSYIHKCLLDNNVISFGYDANGKKHKRNQFVKSIDKINFNANYLVKYKKNTPKIAYIILDSIL